MWKAKYYTDKLELPDASTRWTSEVGGRLPACVLCRAVLTSAKQSMSATWLISLTACNTSSRNFVPDASTRWTSEVRGSCQHVCRANKCKAKHGSEIGLYVDSDACHTCIDQAIARQSLGYGQCSRRSICIVLNEWMHAHCVVTYYGYAVVARHIHGLYWVSVHDVLLTKPPCACCSVMRLHRLSRTTSVACTGCCSTTTGVLPPGTGSTPTIMHPWRRT